ncbi:MAG TPA: lipid-binding SYLF domain-containing protein [Candidatus Angelobacter sp.]|nr:lipid-binding SYLF domain-containing protein [Candidatus Angelobacter sp.]
MKRAVGVGIAFLSLFASVVWADSGEKEKERITDSTNVLKEILDAPDKGIPGSVLNGSKCIIVIPGVKKAALGIGASYGRGVMTCRQGNDFRGPWSAPTMMATESGSIGFQIGGSGTDFVIIVMNEGGARSIQKSKVKLGADASIAAGPVGRTAEAATNGRMEAQMLSYSRSKGVFGGVSLSGASLRVDNDANKNLYGEKVSVDQIIQGQGITTPEQAKPLIDEITAATSKAAPAGGPAKQ